MGLTFYFTKTIPEWRLRAILLAMELLRPTFGRIFLLPSFFIGLLDSAVPIQEREPNEFCAADVERLSDYLVNGVLRGTGAYTRVESLQVSNICCGDKTLDQISEKHFGDHL